MAVSPDRISEHLSVGGKVIPVIRDGNATNGEQNIADGNPAEQAAVGRPLVWRPLRIYPNGHGTGGEVTKKELSPLQTMRERLVEEIGSSQKKLEDLNTKLSMTALDKNTRRQLAVDALAEWVKANDESIRTNPRRSAVKQAKKILIACQKDPAAGVSLPDELKGILQDYKDSSKQYRREVAQRTYHNRQVRELAVWDTYLADQEGLEFARVHLVNQLRAYQNIVAQENLTDNHPRRKRLSISVKVLEVSIAELDRKIPREMVGTKKPFGKFRKDLVEFAGNRRQRFSQTNQLSVEDIVAKVTDINKETLETEVAQVALEEVDESLEPSQYPLARLLPIVLAVSTGTAGLAALDASGAFRNEALSATVQFVSPRDTAIASNGATDIASVRQGIIEPTIQPTDVSTYPPLPTARPTEILIRNGTLFSEPAATKAAELLAEASATEAADGGPPLIVTDKDVRSIPTQNSVTVSPSTAPTLTRATENEVSPSPSPTIVKEASPANVVTVTREPATATPRPTEIPTKAPTISPITPTVNPSHSDVLPTRTVPAQAAVEQAQTVKSQIKSESRPIAPPVPVVIISEDAKWAHEIDDIIAQMNPARRIVDPRQQPKECPSFRRLFVENFAKFAKTLRQKVRVAEIAEANAAIESSCNPQAVGGPNRNGSYDRGLNQLNDGHRVAFAKIHGTWELVYHPVSNTQFAGNELYGPMVKIGKDGFTHWAVYNQGLVRRD